LDWASLLGLDRCIETRRAKGRFIFACAAAVMLGTIVAVFFWLADFPNDDVIRR
jgi:hypothetical protein